MTSYRGILCCGLIAILITANATATTRKTRAAGARAAEPFDSFRRIDSNLTNIDRRLQQLTSRMNDAGQLHRRAERAQALTSLRRSATLRSLGTSSISLVSASRRLELHYQQRRQRYGIRIFTSLHREASSMARSEIRIAHATTMNDFRSAQRRFAADLLAFVLQFQAMSGGYGALECGPGQWACCQPSVRKMGGSSLQGCTWLCTKSIHNCQSGCLGPRTPRNARVVANAARQNSQAR